MPKPDWQNAGFGLYIHWPFCQAKCPYCDFNSHVAEHIDQSAWADAYVSELNRAAETLGDRRLDSVFFGGGTPSLMAPETVQAVLDAVRAQWSVANDWEVTLEANPTSVEAERFAAYRQAGVNRVSLGVQSLNDDDLRRLGRLHSAAEARAAFQVARSTFDRVSFDLIYARQDQSLSAWQRELDQALDLAIDHLSLYQLTIEPGTAFGARHARGGLAGLPDEDLSADMYDLTVERCAEAGLDLYEVSNFARSGAESTHNILYWSGGDYLGIGPGAHGRITENGQRTATEAPREPALWLADVRSGRPGYHTTEALNASDQLAEYLMMGLRTRRGVDRTRLNGMGADENLSQAIRRMQAAGMLDATADRVFVTPRGRSLLNAVLVELLPES